MTSIFVQMFLSVIAGAGLFLMWRKVSVSSPAVAWLVTAGVLIRAIGGQILFWISYLHLPIARALQLGDGFWFFGLDARAYFQLSAAVARSGLVGILLANPGLSSFFYVQTLATMILLFGAIASTSLLLNIAAYLGCCLIALSFGDPKKHRAVVFAIAMLSLAPSTVMWSLQAMKDTWFIFLVASFFGAARLWQQALNRKNASGSRIWWALVMIGTLYGISGVRWYFGFITAMACLLFLVLTILRTSPRTVGIAVALGLAPLLFAAMIFGSGPSISPILRTFGRVGGTRLIALPQTLFKYLNDARSGFDGSGGTTLIGAGHAISAVDARLGDRETRVEATRFGRKPAGPPPTAVSPKPKPQPTPIVAARPAPAAVRTAPVTAVEVEDEATAGTVAMPASHAARFLAGAAAMILPRTIAQGLGILDVRGGRGLWVFAELDTIVFDVVCLFCIVAMVGAIRRRERPEPAFWLILMVTVVIGGLLAYTVSNFGTLFRHREMVLLGLLLLPLAALPTTNVAATPVPEEMHGLAGDVANAVHSA